MYYEARTKALNNNQDFHVVAILYRRRRVIRIETNSDQTHPMALRRFPNGYEAYNLHAEMSVARFACPGDTIEVMRFLSNGEPTMARPCPYCQRVMRRKGIRKVRYTDWDGNWQTMRL